MQLSKLKSSLALSVRKCVIDYSLFNYYPNIIISSIMSIVCLVPWINLLGIFKEQNVERLGNSQSQKVVKNHHED
jgi:hypothetical protein